MSRSPSKPPAAEVARRRPWHRHNYRLWVFGQGTSIVGNQMDAVAQSWLVLQITNDPFALGLLAAAQYGPMLLFGLFGPAVTDPVPKRGTLIVTRSTAAALSGILWLLTLLDIVQLWQIMLLAACVGTVRVFDNSARHAFYPEMVDRKELPSLVGINWTMATVGLIIAPVIAGVLIDNRGVEVPFLINAISSFVFVGAIVAMRSSELTPVPLAKRPTGLGEARRVLGDGLRYVWRSSAIRVAMVLLFTTNAFGMAFNVVIPPLSQDILHLDALGFGLLMSAAGLGSTVVAASVAWSGRASTRPMAWGAIVLGVACLGLAASRIFPASLVFMALAGAGGIGVAALSNATVQVIVPETLTGRVLSVYTTVLAGATPIGGLIMGWIASSRGVPVALGFASAACVGAGIWALLWLSKRGVLGEAVPDR